MLPPVTHQDGLNPAILIQATLPWKFPSHRCTRGRSLLSHCIHTTALAPISSQSPTHGKTHL
uniref:Uncharacterized protein n=1 Tax=Pelusios castaneus TaxID=367368 RepID=A0A8C8RSF0_9SAUR